MRLDSVTVKTIFLEAVEKPAGQERNSFLDEACANNQELKSRVLQLLEAHTAEDPFLDLPAVNHLASDPHLDPPDGSVDSSEFDLEDLKSHISPPLRQGSMGRLGHYEILEIVGRGGMGLVLRAYDSKLHRIVAIKVLAPSLATKGSARKRFVREARAAAAVSHENVIAIHAVEDTHSLPFLVMQFINGMTLQSKVEKEGPLEIHDILRIGLQIADGLAAAHKQGLIHRDIKPANILMENGIQKVKITDFGLARAVDDASLTKSGLIAGTPMYMSPEQASGLAVDHRTDLFSLGSVLYTLCAGHAPFRADSSVAVLKRVCEDTPRPLREVNPFIPVWMQDIVGKLLQKNPADRIQTAEELSDLLSRYLSQVRAGLSPKRPFLGPLGLPGRIPASLALGLLLLLLVLPLGAWGLVSIWGPTWGPREAKGETPGPQAQGATKPWLAPPVPTREQLEGQSSPFDTWKTDRVDPYYLGWFNPTGGETVSPWVGFLGETPWRFPNKGDGHWPTLSPDESSLAIPCGDSVALFATETGKLQRMLKGHSARAFQGAFSPDGRKFACGSGSQVIKVWDPQSGQELLTIDTDLGDVWKVLFNPAGDQIIAAGGSGQIGVWDGATGKEIRSLGKAEGGIHGLVFSPDGEFLWAGTGKGQIQVWKWKSGELVQTLDGPKGKIHQLVFSSDGKRVAWGSDEKVGLFDALSRQPLRSFSSPGAGLLGFTPDGTHLLCAPHNTGPFDEREITRWDVQGGAKISEVSLPGNKCLLVGCLNRQANRIYTASCVNDGRMGVFDPLTGENLFPNSGHFGQILSLALSPRGDLIVSGGSDRQIKVWPLAKDGSPNGGPKSRDLSGHTSEVWALAFHPEGHLLASGGLDGVIRIWSMPNGEIQREIRVGSRVHFPLAFSPDGRYLAAGGAKGEIRIWDTSEWREKEPIQWHGGEVRALAFSHDSTMLASGGRDKLIQVLSFPAGKKIHTIRGTSLITNLQFSPSDATLASVCDFPGPSLKLFELPSKKQTDFLGHSHHVNGLDWHPLGIGLVTGGFDGNVGLWTNKGDTLQGKMIATDKAGPTPSVKFTPEGRFVAVGLGNGLIGILRWDEASRPEPGP